MARSGFLALAFGVLVAVVGCRAIDPEPIAGEAPENRAVAPQPNLLVTLAHGSCHRPPCSVGIVEDIASGERTTVYDFDLAPLGLSDSDRAALTRTLFEGTYAIAGAIQDRTGYLGAEGPVAVVVVAEIIGQESASTVPTSQPVQPAGSLY